MIPKETADLYMSIQAPEHLMQKILEKADKPQKIIRHPWKSMLAAACLTLVVAASTVILNMPTAKLYFQDTAVEKSPVAVTSSLPIIARSRTEEAFFVQIPLELRNDADITVSHGELQQTEDNGKTSESFIWQIPVDAMIDTEAELTVTIKGKETNYSLFTNETGTWYLVKTD